MSIKVIATRPFTEVTLFDLTPRRPCFVRDRQDETVSLAIYVLVPPPAPVVGHPDQLLIVFGERSMSVFRMREADQFYEFLRYCDKDEGVTITGWTP